MCDSTWCVAVLRWPFFAVLRRKRAATNIAAAVKPTPILADCTYRQRGRLTGSGTSRRRCQSKCLNTCTCHPQNRRRPNAKRLATWDGCPYRRDGIFLPTHSISLTLPQPATIGAIITLLVSCFADEEWQCLDQSRAVRACAIGTRTIVRQESVKLNHCLNTGSASSQSPVSLYRFLNVKACPSSKSVIHPIHEVSSCFLYYFPDEPWRSLLKQPGGWEKTYPRLFAALAVFKCQRRESHQEWRCIVALELNNSKQLDDA